MKRRSLAAIIGFLLLSCEPVAHQLVTLTFNDTADQVRISATTTLGKAKAGTAEYGQIEEQREALLAGRDEWSLRFANADPESDRVAFERTRGQLQAVEHSATIPSDNLQKFFFDTPLSVTVTRAEGWAELTIYPGSSMRASREQRLKVEKMLVTYSERAARYFDAIRSLYFYLEEKPQRATDLFTVVYGKEGENTPILSDQEESLATSVKNAVDHLISVEEAPNMDHDFDLVFNPFPADLKVVVPGEVLAIEGFVKDADGSVVVKTPTALEAVAMLQGRWISPDLFAVALAAKNDETAEQLAALTSPLPRHAASVVSATEIARALSDKMRPAPRYRLRWLIKRAASR